MLARTRALLQAVATRRAEMRMEAAGRLHRAAPPGPAPEHETDVQGRRIRFRHPDGRWGDWISLADITIARGGGGVTESRVIQLIQEQRVPVNFDDYEQADTREGQAGPGVKPFTFDAEVQLVKVHPRSTNADAVAWAAADADLTPADGTGDPCPANQDTHLFGNRLTLQVYVPDGMTVYVTGYRRTAA